LADQRDPQQNRPQGMAFPAAPDGRRSTSALGRAVVADALRGTDPTGALGAEQETNWRSGYLTHFRRLIEAGLASRDAAMAIASGGLDSLYERMRFAGPDGEELPVSSLRSASPRRSLGTTAVTGQADPETELVLPYRGHQLRGDDLARRLETWVHDGIIEPSCAEAVRTVASHPQWLSLPGRTVAVLGAGSEIGPLPVLLRWGATVAGVDLPRHQLWEGACQHARAGAGTLLVPVRARADSGSASDADVTRDAGLDLTSEVPEAASWLAGLDGPLVLGNYVYADGEANVRVCMAADVLALRLQADADDLALAILATPTDVFAVPAAAVTQSVQAYASRPRVAKLAGRPLRTLSGGRLLRRAYLPGANPGINDSLVAQQGPNYALAKRLQRWRATVARDGGALVSLNVAPPTRTRSVLKNRALAAAYSGAHRFGVEAFEPDTCRVLMAALLVHDLNTGGGPRHGDPWQDEAFGAAHGGLWRIAYAPRSALGLAALLGYGSART
jgi:hypothetical protein